MTLILALMACTENTTIDVGATDDTADSGEAVVEPAIEDWEGDWIGTLVLDAFGEDYFDGCEGEIELDFDDDGEVDGDGVCDYGDLEYEFEFEGEVDAEGNLEGEMIIAFVYAGDTPVAVTGSAEDENTIEAEYAGTYEYSSWGTDYVYDIGGTLSLERE